MHIIFIYIDIIIFPSVILKKIKIIFIRDIVPVVPVSVITSISLKLHRLSTIPD